MLQKSGLVMSLFDYSRTKGTISTTLLKGKAYIL